MINTNFPQIPQNGLKDAMVIDNSVSDMNFPYHPCDDYLHWMRIESDIESYPIEDLTVSNEVDLGYVQDKMKRHKGYWGVDCKCAQCYNFFYKSPPPPPPKDKVVKLAKSPLHYLLTFSLSEKVYPHVNTDPTVVIQTNDAFLDWTQDVVDVLNKYKHHATVCEYVHERGTKKGRLHIHAHVFATKYWDQSMLRDYTSKWGTVDIKKGEVDNGITEYISKDRSPIKLV